MEASRLVLSAYDRCTTTGKLPLEESITPSETGVIRDHKNCLGPNSAIVGATQIEYRGKGLERDQGTDSDDELLENRKLTPMESDLTNIRREIRHLGKMYGSDHHMKLIGSLKQLYHYLFMEMGSTEESTYLNKWNELSKMLADRGKPDRNRPLVGGRLMFVLFLLGDYMKQYKPISSEFHKHIHIFQENNLSGIVKAFMEFRILSNWWFEPIDFIPTLELISNEALKPFSRFMKGIFHFLRRILQHQVGSYKIPRKKTNVA
ncbi:hypothetical protein PGTUg99_016286 [Puccinia graminis f. sp. tritici]|uniref:Uncharacterized protein n=1 Tax=Puccinia graminis f. sp. tritici TaxID=56615 RepID=A0A5B0Q425_PUCGR|nr:hypothetical protein PGTUg99_016286 [Puccinia graminis f. sp. tritici]